METMGLSNLPHFTSGGSVHIIVNNQLGYTTPSANAHSAIYPSDVGKMVHAPTIHVNADYPEEVARAASIALDYRQAFRKDVIINMVSYRKWGHNELDEPAFTQPLMYKNIRVRKSVPRLYEEQLIAKGVLDASAVEEFRQNYFDKLDRGIKAAESYTPKVSYEASLLHLG